MTQHLQLRLLTDSAFEVTAVDGTVVIDLGVYTPAALRTVPLTAAVCTHQHTDHCDVTTLAALGIPVWAPADTIAPLREAGVERSFVLQPGIPSAVTASLTVTPYPVVHGVDSKPIDNYGVVIECNGFRVWHCGDIGADRAPHPPGRFDAVLLPVGGTYVFDARAARDYLEALGHRGLAIPMHFDYAPEQAERFIAESIDASWTTSMLRSGQVHVLTESGR